MLFFLDMNNASLEKTITRLGNGWAGIVGDVSAHKEEIIAHYEAGSISETRGTLGSDWAAAEKRSLERVLGMDPQGVVSFLKEYYSDVDKGEDIAYWENYEYPLQLIIEVISLVHEREW